MPLVHRVLYPTPIMSLKEYLTRGGGTGIEAARRMDPPAIIERVLASGLRGRGGAGFPAGRKWQTVAENRSPGGRATVVVNAAEGEPGTFKDRTILRRNPYLVIEGALIAARAVGADLVIVATKRAFGGEIDRLRDAIEQVEDAGWNEAVTVRVFEGPDEYLYGEESALLETIDGRWPFPRIVPTFRRGLDEIGSGLGSAGFIVFDDTADMVAVAAGVARFLAIESCGQCSPCKLDGITLSGALAKMCASDAGAYEQGVVVKRLNTVAQRSRCF